jgi:hypothetical protein
MSEQLQHNEEKNTRPKLVVAIGERASDDSGRVWIDPDHRSAIVERGNPEKCIARFDVIKTVAQDDGSTLVAYVREGHGVVTYGINPDITMDELSEHIVTHVVHGDGGAMDLEYYTRGKSGNDLLLSIQEAEDGLFHAECLAHPNIHIRSIGGGGDSGIYRLNGSKLEMYKLQDRTSLMELGASSWDIIELVAGSPPIASTNYGTTITGSDHGEGFLPVEGKPGRSGRPLSNEFAGEIPVAAHH